ncbi:hypothetical protein [Rouxiella badensis]|uniref:hypothetical protein n=1 Tax=Rouxiella badensis TaxID=1646377 RepID=UPI0017889653|nr:hypothetical protein [Rouxiella badensis]QOI58083.1 hypothetical protein H2866_23305 [Rouxiella badensis subsp. acadiensis]
MMNDKGKICSDENYRESGYTQGQLGENNGDTLKAEIADLNGREFYNLDARQLLIYRLCRDQGWKFGVSLEVDTDADLSRIEETPDKGEKLLRDSNTKLVIRFEA